MLLVGVVGGLYRTYRVEHSPNQAKFWGGHVPSTLPSGFFKGSALTGLGKNWQGKVFDRHKGKGINQFTDGKRYSFRVYPAAGLRDADMQVLRIDYNQPGNPWWLRFVVDEIVQVSPGHYLGKVHVKILPGLPFSLTYFELSST